MGAYISIETCQSQYNIALNCSVPSQDSPQYHANNHTYDYIGNSMRGTFEANADIAGIGILAVFLAITSFALVASMVDVGWQLCKTVGWKSTKPQELKAGSRSFSDIIQTLVLSCSDQQVFTGASFAITLRYWRGCSISAYHYNIVANMLLLTCATHLMSVTIVRNYWKYPFLAFLRIVCITGVFIVTGLLMVNQNAVGQMRFPTTIPASNETDSLLFLPAACFQSANSPLAATFADTTASDGAFFRATLGSSAPGNKIQGWNWYVVMLLFYGAAIVAELVRFVRRGRARPGWRGRLGARVARVVRPKSLLRRATAGLFVLYLVTGAALGFATVVESGMYIFSLRAWVNSSGWIALDNGINPENDATSFGQLVPIFMSAMVLFTFAQTISEKVTDHETRKHDGSPKPPQEGTIAFLDPLQYDIQNMDKKGGSHFTVTTATADPEAAQPWPSTWPLGNGSSVGSGQAPLLGGNSLERAISLEIDPFTGSRPSYGQPRASPGRTPPTRPGSTTPPPPPRAATRTVLRSKGGSPAGARRQTRTEAGLRTRNQTIQGTPPGLGIF